MGFDNFGFDTDLRKHGVTFTVAFVRRSHLIWITLVGEKMWS